MSSRRHPLSAHIAPFANVLVHSLANLWRLGCGEEDVRCVAERRRWCLS
jgi:hypothetical protein